MTPSTSLRVDGERNVVESNPPSCGSPSRRPYRRYNMIPLIDVSLVLLIIFMVLTRSSSSSRFA